MERGRNYNNMSQRGWRAKTRKGLKQRLLNFLDSQDHPGYFPSDERKTKCEWQENWSIRCKCVKKVRTISRHPGYQRAISTALGLT